MVASVASSISASVWGWMADTSSRRVMLRGGDLQPVTLGQVAGAGMHIVEDGLRAGQEVAL